MTLKFWLPLLALIQFMQGCIPTVRQMPTPGPGDLDSSASPAGSESPSMDLYKPAVGDISMERGDVKIDGLAILVSDSFPPQYWLEVKGSLPSPCHELRIVADAPSMENEIRVQIYSVYDPYAACAQAIKPFEASIPLGGYVRGSYTVLVNGREVGEIMP